MMTLRIKSFRKHWKTLWLRAAFSSVQFSCLVVSDSLWPHELQHTRLSCPSPSSRACSNSCPLSQWSHPTILSSVIPSPPAFSLSQHQGLFQWVSSSHHVAKELELQLHHQSFQWKFTVDFPSDWLVGSPCSPRDSRVFSSTAEKSGLLLLCNVVSCRIPLWTLHHT